MGRPVLVVANPVSGRGRSLALARALERELAARGVPAEVRETRGPGDAERIAAEATDATPALAVVGGDGTLNEIVNGRRGRGYPVALLPSGTANVLGRELLLPATAAGLAALLASPRVRRIDLGEANGRLFVSLASAGFDAAVTREIRLSRRGALSPFSYVVPALRAFREYGFPALSLSIGGLAPKPPALGVVVAKTRNYAGYFRIARSVRPDDGRLEVCSLAHGRRRALVRYFSALALGRLSRARGVEYHEGVSEVRIDSDVPVPYQVDGDYAGETPLVVRVLPGALPVVVPEEGS